MGHGGGGAMSGELDRAAVPAGVRRRRARRARRLGGADAAGLRRAAGWRSRPTRSWSSRCSSPAARSATSRSTAPSTTSRCPARRRCTSRPRSSSPRAPPLTDIGRVATAVGKAAEVAGVQLVTGDTKVVDSGSGDGVYVNTAGIGRGRRRRRDRSAPGRGRRRGDRQRRHRRARHRGDELPRGPGVRHHDRERHRAAARAGRGDARHRRRRARAARPDPRRGVGDAQRDRPGLRGRASSWSSATCRCPPRSRDACGLLGLDPLQVANEGKLLAIVPARPGRRGAGRDAGATRSAAAPGGSAPASPSTRGWWWRAPGSAAPGWWTCRSASSCPGSAEADAAERAGRSASRSTPTRRTSWATAARPVREAMLAPDATDEIEPAGAAVRGRLELPGVARRGGRHRRTRSTRRWSTPTGSAATCSTEVDPAALVARLRDRFRRPGRRHLARGRRPGPSPHHSFQVFEVYPWAGLLREGRPPGPPCGCWTGAGSGSARCVAVDGEQVRWSRRPLAWDGLLLREGAAGRPSGPAGRSDGQLADRRPAGRRHRSRCTGTGCATWCRWSRPAARGPSSSRRCAASAWPPSETRLASVEQPADVRRLAGVLRGVVEHAHQPGRERDGRVPPLVDDPLVVVVAQRSAGSRPSRRAPRPSTP